MGRHSTHIACPAPGLTVPAPNPNMAFNYEQDFQNTDFRAHPELYQVGKGEQGVLSVQPYKREILPFWRFATPQAAQASADKIFALFLDYLAHGDFVGADMARKFLQMGYTRSRRYANHAGGKKYEGPVPDDKKGQSGAWGRNELPRTQDPIKAESAAIFKARWDEAKANLEYQALAKAHQAQTKEHQARTKLLENKE